VSKAFTSEETADDPVIIRARPPLPAGVPNYVTARGLGLLREELAALERERTALEGALTARDRLPPLQARIGELTARITGAVPIDPTSGGPAEVVRFGATVAVRDGAGRQRRYQIVGVDEANARQGRLAFVSPLARALLGRRVGDAVVVQTPGAEQELEILAVEYAADAVPDEPGA
jgi:transcription elongation factor GreB